MNLARWTGVVQSASGMPIAGAQIEVRREDTGALVQVYSDRQGLIALGNPFISQSATVGFHAPGGSYRVKAFYGSATTEWRFVAIGTAAELDIDPLLEEVAATVAAGLDGVYREENVLGTVAQSGGLPTGALFERGNNANGWYVRFADGTQICQVGMSAGTWTFPAVFAGGGISVMGNAVAASVRIMCAVSNITSSSASLLTYDTNPTNNRTGHQAYWIAIGRWF